MKAMNETSYKPLPRPDTHPRGDWRTNNAHAR